MKFITISKTSGEINTHQRKNATSLYPLLSTLVVTIHLSISRSYFPWVGLEDGTLKEPVGLVLDAFRGHFDKKVKAHNTNHPLLKWLMMDGGIHRWELLGNYPVFNVVMVIYHYFWRIWRILVTPNFLYNIYNHE